MDKRRHETWRDRAGLKEMQLSLLGGVMEVEVLDTYLIKVTLTRDGFTASAFVTSHHLVEDKRPQLEAAISREAAAAFID